MSELVQAKDQSKDQAKDQTKVEVLWNSIYNSYLEPQLDEVPIGFTYKKYLEEGKCRFKGR